MMEKAVVFEWICPECGAAHQKHGKGGKQACADRRGKCEGLICDCEDLSGNPYHGRSLSNKCSNAVCTHCDWSGVLQRAPKRITPWEKKALEAGWSPPAKRAAELGLKEETG